MEITVRADQLVIGDNILNDDESYDEVIEVHTDDDGTWLETTNSMGYVNSYQEFIIEN